MEQAALICHAPIERGTGVGRQDVEGGRLDTLLNGPFHGALEDIGTVLVHAEDETGVDHNAKAMQPPDGFGIIAVDVLELALRAESLLIGTLEADEKAAQSAGGRLFEQRG